MRHAVLFKTCFYLSMLDLYVFSVYVFVLVYANVYANVYVGDVYTDMFLKMCFTCLHIYLNVNNQYIYIYI